MSVRLLCRCLLLVLLCPSWAEKQTCLTSASNCEECIQSGPACAWCSTGPSSNIRCHTSKELRRAGCRKNDIYYPEGSVQVVKNDSSTELADAKTLFLQPQELSLHLRPGLKQSFPLTIIMPTDQPIMELTMDTGPVPAGVNISFRSIMNGNPVVIQVTVEADQCPSNRTGPWSVHITPKGFSLSVKLEITLECQCDCKKIREENSPACNGNGARVCGRCACYDPYVGQQCQTEFFYRGEDDCSPGPDAPLCSGRGKCVMGGCECQERENPNERYSGQYCQCSNFECPFHRGRICGGNGRCDCGKCVCDAGWTDEDCSCSLETESCLARNGQICNGRGNCLCGICECTNPRFRGPTCEQCPLCPGVCAEHKDCVECRAFGTGARKDRCDQDCDYLNVTTVESRADLNFTELVVSCKERNSDDDCFFFYSYSRPLSGHVVHVARAKECPKPFHWG
ncbi:integrin beta-1-like [Plectropomus leopardus]|uniref:integrin beta-1-like n=1 Tax=Plectropomus leopardus TaxID=160734 RepID=UPI001C4D8B9E|nr:integrin beta-1-like [Plectropomus leopardus]XP_042346626.1 integrin beta-1-like [Plectropomus leopardus]